MAVSLIHTVVVNKLKFQLAEEGRCYNLILENKSVIGNYIYSAYRQLILGLMPQKHKLFSLTTIQLSN